MPVLVATFAVWTAGCPSPSGEGASGRQTHPLTVLAASSLQDVARTLQPRFQQSHPTVELRFAFAGSQQLQLQVERGAEADVFLAADPRHLEALAQRGLTGEPVRFACNEVVVGVPRGNPAKVQSLGDLATVSHVVLAAPEVPAGALSEEVLSAASRLYGDDFAARVRRNVRSRELNVRQVMAKLMVGEADAALVYRSDVKAAKGRVEAIPLPDAVRAVAHYEAAALTHSGNPAAARAFLTFLAGPQSASAFHEEGFVPCPDPAGAR